MNLFKDLRKNEKLVTIMFYVLLVFTAIYDFIFRDGVKFGRIILIAVTVLAMLIFCKKSFLKKSSTAYFVILGFIFISMYLANVWNWYGIPKYDKILHTFSGAIIAVIGYILYIYLFGDDNSSKIKKSAPIVFVIAFSTAAAGVWEIWEFTTDTLFGLCAQNNSLNDTMWDIICGTIMGILTTIPIYLRIIGKKIKILDYIIEEMRE